MLAALAGYTDLPYRLICRRMGARYASTEVTLDTSINLSPRVRNKLIQTHPDDHPLAAQIMGVRAESMVTAARHVVAMGCDVVDLNFACPVRKVIGRRRGGHMMRAPETAIEILQAVRSAVDVPVTVKLRCGFAEADTTHEAFWRIAEAAFDAGVAAICVHGRSVEQHYSGRCDWGFLAEVKRHFADKTVLGSGDLMHPEDAVRMIQETGVDGVAFARGALGNPWIFGQFAQLVAGEPVTLPTLADQRAVLEEHYRLCLEQFGLERGPRMIYRFGIKYASYHPTPKVVRMAFINAGVGEKFNEIIAEHYN